MRQSLHIVRTDVLTFIVKPQYTLGMKKFKLHLFYISKQYARALNRMVTTQEQPCLPAKCEYNSCAYAQKYGLKQCARPQPQRET